MNSPDRREYRIGNVERQTAVDALGEHFAQGRLEAHEFEERTIAAYGARTAAELDQLFLDLPRPAELAPQAPQFPAPQFPAPQFPAPQFPAPHYPAGHAPPFPGHAFGSPPWPGAAPDAPYGREPATGLPYSDRQKVVAGLLQIFLPFGVGRLYTGHAGIAIAQFLTVFFFGLGVLWCIIDGIVLLTGRTLDQYGRPLR